MVVLGVVVLVLFVIILCLMPATYHQNKLGSVSNTPVDPPISYEVLEHRPIYRGSQPTGTGVRMDVVIPSTASSADVLALAKYFRQRYAGDFIDIQIWDSTNAWSTGRLWDKYANEGNKEKVAEINKVIEEHLLICVFYNPRISDPSVGDWMDGAALKWEKTRK